MIFFKYIFLDFMGIQFFIYLNYYIYIEYMYLVISFCNFYSELFKKEENINKDKYLIIIIFFFDF